MIDASTFDELTRHERYEEMMHEVKHLTWPLRRACVVRAVDEEVCDGHYHLTFMVDRVPLVVRFDLGAARVSMEWSLSREVRS